MDQEKISAFVQAHRGVRAIAQHIKGRKNDSAVTTADTVQSLRSDDGERIGRPLAVDALKQLAAAGFGVFKVGRGEQKTRIIWGASPQEIFSTVAVPQAKYSEPPSAEPGTNGEVPTARESTETFAPTNTFEFRFPLRHEFPVTLVLPKNWTADDRKRLSDAVLSLPVA
jgi:hypothetical protein